MNKIRVLVKEPGKAPEERKIESTLKAFQTIVGGHVEGVCIYDDVCCYINDEGKFKNLEPNFVLPIRRASGYDVVCGPAVFFRVDLEGNEASLTLTDILYLDRLLLDSDAANFILNGRPLAELWEA